MNIEFHYANPKLLAPDLLMQKGFMLPGLDHPISLGVRPYELTPEKFEEVISAAKTLRGVNTKALAYAYHDPFWRSVIFAETKTPDKNQIDETISQTGDFPNTLAYLQNQTTLVRPDILVTPNPSHSHKLLEFNATRPGGIYLVWLASQVLTEAGHTASQLRSPQISDLWSRFLEPICKQRNLPHPRIALCYASGFVSQIEMPKLAGLIQEHLDRRNISGQVFSCDRRELHQVGNIVLDKNNSPVDVVYENAAPDVSGNNFYFHESSTGEGTVVINPPIASLGDNKALLALYFDPNFQRHLSPSEKATIEKYVPHTQLINSPDNLKSFMQSHAIEDTVLKIPGGLRGSSGKGVYVGPKISSEDILNITSDLRLGVPYIAQEKIPPSSPWYSLLRLSEQGEVQTVNTFIDFAPFLSTVDGITACLGVICRAKPDHPINVSQGGAILPAATY